MSHPPGFPPATAWYPLLERSLEEDLGSGDITSSLVVPADHRGAAGIEARSPLVICGLPLAAAVFQAVDTEIQFEACRQEGERAEAGEIIARVEGALVGLLAGERTALNFLYRLCGIATLTRRYVEAVAGTGVAIVDTRKTIPGWRSLDKYAVRVGGAVNHRAGLYDAILIKDNHIAAVGGVTPAVKAARAAAPPHLWIQVEVESEVQAEEALAAGADSLLLDNRSLDELRQLVRRFRDRCVLEASGGITLETVRSVAETGVHRISVGALTHSAAGADLALEIQGARARP